MSRKRPNNQHHAETGDAPALNALGDDQLRREIEMRAYYRYCERGCTPGGDVEDWLAAEQELLAKQAATGATSPE